MIQIRTPEWPLNTMGHYNMPKNFGWSWVAPVAVSSPNGDEYEWLENAWILLWTTSIGIY